MRAMPGDPPTRATGPTPKTYFFFFVVVFAFKIPRLLIQLIHAVRTELCTCDLTLTAPGIRGNLVKFFLCGVMDQV